MGDCMRLLYSDGFVRAPGAGDVALRDFVALIAENKNATLTWEQDGDSYILHDRIEDKVAGVTKALDLQFVRVEEPGEPSEVCGPRQVVVRRAVLNGVELKGIQLTLSIDAMLDKLHD